MTRKLPTALDSLFDQGLSTATKDLKLNFKRLVENGALEATEAAAATLAIATSLGLAPLAAAAREELRALDFTSEQIEEAAESAALMGMLNTYYRFRHFLTEKQPDLAELYRNAGLRMTALARPLLGKERFEMLAFAVSVINGCETCIVAHERVLREGGIAAEKIHDLARLAAVLKGAQGLSHAHARLED
jgi:alkyl hydroperoxide reductase subunit D